MPRFRCRQVYCNPVSNAVRCTVCPVSSITKRTLVVSHCHQAYTSRFPVSHALPCFVSVNAPLPFLSVTKCTLVAFKCHKVPCCFPWSLSIPLSFKCRQAYLCHFRVSQIVPSLFPSVTRHTFVVFQCHKVYSDAYRSHVSSPSNATLAAYFDAHNAYVQQLHAANAMVGEFNGSTQPQLLQVWRWPVGADNRGRRADVFADVFVAKLAPVPSARYAVLCMHHCTRGG